MNVSALDERVSLTIWGIPCKHFRESDEKFQELRFQALAGRNLNYKLTESLPVDVCRDEQTAQISNRMKCFFKTQPGRCDKQSFFPADEIAGFINDKLFSEKLNIIFKSGIALSTIACIEEN